MTLAYTYPHLLGDPDYEDDFRPHWVYRYYQNDWLLYIGFTNNHDTRDNNHRCGSPWYHLATHRTIEEYPDRWAADFAETKAIAREMPAFNIKDNPRPNYNAIRTIMGLLRLRNGGDLSQLPAPRNTPVLLRAATLVRAS